MTETVTYTESGAVATITLARPDRYNALSIEMWETVATYIEHAASADAVRVAVVTGEGDVFCSGDDINTLAEIEDEADVRALTDAIYACFTGIETASIPVIGSANGSAYGGGFELLMACDLTVVPEDAEFALPEVQIGAYPLYGAKRLGRLVGRQRAMELAVTGREISATQAVEWGLFTRAVPADKRRDVVDDWVAALTKGSPAAIEATKAWVTASLQLPTESIGMQTGLGYLYAGSDPGEGAASFLEDHDPDFAE